MIKTDILFLNHNRKAYAEASWKALRSNTDWTKVGRLFILDDESTDGTQFLVDAWARQVAGRAIHGRWGSPVTAMSHFLAVASLNGNVAKVDSDTLVPPGWLDDCCELLEKHQEFSILGIECRGAGGEANAPTGADRSVVHSEWVGGIFVARGRIFADPEDLPRRDYEDANRKFYGWQTWQMHRPHHQAAWIEPGLQVVLLDRLATEPWCKLGESYVRSGWQRVHPYYYEPDRGPCMEWAEDILKR
jgi:hypothetical protein